MSVAFNTGGPRYSVNRCLGPALFDLPSLLRRIQSRSTSAPLHKFDVGFNSRKRASDKAFSHFGTRQTYATVH